MFQVSEVSRRLGLNPQTLYFYERIGLMPPPKRTAAGYRLYDEPALERLSFTTWKVILKSLPNKVFSDWASQG